MLFAIQKVRGIKRMKIVLAALNAKYVHSNLAVYDLEAYANKRLNGRSS